MTRRLLVIISVLIAIVALSALVVAGCESLTTDSTSGATHSRWT
jgi:hypothetical protein